MAIWRWPVYDSDEFLWIFSHYGARDRVNDDDNGLQKEGIYHPQLARSHFVREFFVCLFYYYVSLTHSCD